MKKKIFIFLPDGVGLRNFAFTRFNEIGKQKGYEISKPKLKFDEKKAKYIYYAINKITKSKNANGSDCGETEIIEIDALNGEVLSLEKGYYGLIIR